MAPKASRKRQTKLSFSPTSKPQRDLAQPNSTAATPTISKLPKSGKPSKAIFDSSYSEDELQQDKNISTRSVKSTARGTHRDSVVQVDTSKLRGKKEQAKPGQPSCKRQRTEDSSESDEAMKAPVKRSKRSKHRTDITESELGDPRVPRTRWQKGLRVRPTSDIVRDRAEGEVWDDDDGDEEEQLPVRSARHRGTRRITSVEEEEEEEEEGGKGDKESSPPRNKRRRIARPSSSRDDGLDDDMTDASSTGAVDNESNEAMEDLKEDLAFLRSSPLPDRGKLRSTHEKPKSDRQKALEALKKRRAGVSEPSSSATPSRARRIVESDSELEVIKEEPESDLGCASQSEESGDEEESEREANALDMFQEDNEDEVFIDDDDVLIGEPLLGPEEILPLAFTRLASAKPKDLFKYAIEWMVMKKIHPAFDSNSQIYDLTFRKLDDEVKGLANSKFSSSAWTSAFSRALRARPDLMENELVGSRRALLSEHCEACNRSDRTATWELMFMGQPYDRETLEPLGTASDSDSSGDSDGDSELSVDSETELNGEKPTYDAQGERLPPENKSFSLGSTCKANAHVAHTLQHWRYHLYQWVKEYLADEGYLSAEELKKRDKWSDRKREKKALKVINKMEEDGKIKKLYRSYKEQVTYAIEVNNEYKDGWGKRRR